MFHPNVYANGELCLDILQNRWSPTYDVAAILTSIQSLFNDPNPNSCVPHFELCSAVGALGRILTLCTLPFARPDPPTPRLLSSTATA